MEMEEIRAWLNSSKAYDAGVSLYRAYGTDVSALQQLQGGETPLNKKLLFTSIRALVAGQPAPVPGQQQDPVIETHILQSNDAVIAAKRDADRLYKEMANARAELLAMCTVEESPRDTDPEEKKKRGTLAKRIMQLENMVEDAYADYRYAQEHGVRKEKQALVVEEIDPVDLHKEISNLRKYLSKLRKDPVKNAGKITKKESLLNNYLKLYDQAKAGGSVVAGKETNSG